MAWMGSEESRMEIVSSTREWAAVCIRVRDGDDGGGLDLGQMVEHWSYWRFLSGKSNVGVMLVQEVLPEILADAGAKEWSWGEGDGTYRWRNVRPVGWLAGRRRLSKMIVEQAPEGSVGQEKWRWVEVASFGEAMAWLLWMRLGWLDSGGKPGDELGMIDSRWVHSAYGIDVGHEGDAWWWKADDEGAPCGKGRFGLSLLDLDVQKLRVLRSA